MNQVPLPDAQEDKSKSDHEAPQKDWTPPLLFAAIAFASALLGDFLGVAEKIYGWLSPSSLPAVSERYIVIDLETEGDLDAKVEKLTAQLSGVRFVRSKWLTDDAVTSATGTAVAHFCSNATAAEMNRVESMEKCVKETRTRVRLGTYALQSHDPKPIDSVDFDLAELWNEGGVIDGYDGFLNGRLNSSPDCFLNPKLGHCLATRRGTETLRLGPIATGETLVVPLYLLVLLEWSDQAHDGLVVAPARFPSQVRLGDRILIEVPREMNETPTISLGTYEGRG